MSVGCVMETEAVMDFKGQSACPCPLWLQPQAILPLKLAVAAHAVNEWALKLLLSAASHYEHFDMIHYGSYLSALSPFWLAAFQRGEGHAFVFVKARPAGG